MRQNNIQVTKRSTKKIRKSTLITLIFIVTLLISCLLTGCNKTKTLDLMEYATVEFSGVDSKGTAYLSIDWSAFEDALATEITDFNQLLEASLALESTIEYSLDKTTGLSNGDKVNLSVSWNEESAKSRGFSFKGKQQTFTVEGLKEAVEIDLFADIHVDFDGVSPDLTVTIRNTSKDPFIQNVYYTADPAYDVAEGDTITVKATYLKVPPMNMAIYQSPTRKHTWSKMLTSTLPASSRFQWKFLSRWISKHVMLSNPN